MLLSKFMVASVMDDFIVTQNFFRPEWSLAQAIGLFRKTLASLGTMQLGLWLPFKMKYL